MDSATDLNSPVEKYTFEGQTFFLKRDDLLHPDFSGNKARKFYYYLHHDFPHISTLVSYGSAQSNAMYSLSVLAKMKRWCFEYYVDHVAEYLKAHPHGNYQAALNNGMQLHEASFDKKRFGDDTLFIEEGGRQKEAEFGIQKLAEEIEVWQKSAFLDTVNIFLPAGTGTTALFLQKHLPNCTVYTTPCVGDAEYLKEQFLMLETNEKNHPRILSMAKKHHLGKLYKENYTIWLKLQEQTGVVFDLLYDPLGWRVVLKHPELFSKPLLYIHQGGVLGNESMLARYERKYKDKM
ncbi:MAG TPA: 1-aminocyclopropane-1-carboxylate deaminase/D-cysteine desulfhydrase [Sulfurovum sp.]|nr:1-aminocyclopropane-1-carboxylate deaminase/D-cysteine desulfhydrase [Sulfurovum sp.]HQS72526.1 1-aminocyclopropane-1-carboxylate deaminase/D-cysteine desulfhydrase [Sulfurovum sp.]HQS77126.1 1-aminocyclopropane-1-carboxylate deaminase/D-cysteine desulfhydrase [Sulfurovum sp.]HQT28586.1 1-aminocyclopropane-1-carboxylate deaminase/D-cysteine desulfhydrase [Sulfurovum sp.]